MSLNITGILIDKLPNSDTSFEVKKMEINRIDELSPKKLSITFIENSTLILLDNVFFKNVNEDSELTSLEKDILDIFPESNVWIFVLNETVDFFGFSNIKYGKKVRSKFFGQGRPFLDYGELHSVEKHFYNEYSEILFKDKNIKSIFDDKYKELEKTEVDKQFLIFRDLILKKKNIENNFEYLSGNMETHYIENLFKNLLKINIIDILQLKFVIFSIQKFNFEKESLKNYILTAYNKLHNKNFC